MDINVSLKNMYSNELRAGRTMLKYIEIQDKFITDMNEAIARSDVTVLNQLLVQSERYSLTHSLTHSFTHSLTHSGWN